MENKNYKRKYSQLMNRDYLRTIKENDDAFYDYLDRITKIASSIFVWKNLPTSMDGEWLELCLYWYGECALVYDKQKGHINTKCATAGYLNIYGLPTQINCFSYGYQKQLPVYYGTQIGDEYSQCIHVLNNRLKIPTVVSIERFCEKLANADLTADINIRAQKTPIIVVGEESQKLTLKNLYTQYAGNSPIIFGDKDVIKLDSLKVLKTDAPFVADQIMNYKKEIWNELLTFLGINNIVTDKRERQIKDEVNSNNELININLRNSLQSRQKACDLFNKKYNLTGDKQIKVELNSDLNNVLKDVLSTVKELVPVIDESESDING